MESFELTYKPFGEYALLIEWPTRIDESILKDTVALQRTLEQELGTVLIESIVAYNSITVLFNPDKISFKELQNKIEIKYSTMPQSVASKSKLWKIPVCYNEQFGVDLREISNALELEVEELIAKHCEPLYTVYFIGFLPGFLYLGGLPESLHFARKSTPRLHIKQGAIAIGGNQTGIYPMESPGGWNILGNSPLIFFDPHQTSPCFARPGDKIRFYSIHLDHYHHLKEEIEIGRYKPVGEPV